MRVLKGPGYYIDLLFYGGPREGVTVTKGMSELFCIFTDLLSDIMFVYFTQPLPGGLDEDSPQRLLI